MSRLRRFVTHYLRGRRRIPKTRPDDEILTDTDAGSGSGSAEAWTLAVSDLDDACGTTLLDVGGRLLLDDAHAEATWYVDLFHPWDGAGSPPASRLQAYRAVLCARARMAVLDHHRSPVPGRVPHPRIAHGTVLPSTSPIERPRARILGRHPHDHAAPDITVWTHERAPVDRADAGPPVEPGTAGHTS